MLTIRSALDDAHVALIYLLIVLGGSSRGGRAIGLSLSAVAFLCFNFFFLPPYYTLIISEPLDWLVLVVFLITATIAAQLLARAQSEAGAAQRRAVEIDRLSSLGAETLNAGRADEALAAIAEVIRTTLEVARCEIYLRDEPSRGATLVSEVGTQLPTWDEPASYGGASLVDWVAANGRAALEREDGSVRIEALPGIEEPPLELSDARAVLVPLRVHTRTVGVLRIANDSALSLDRAQQRFLKALSYYAALGAERVRLVAQAERAEALRQADELKDALLASVSHDIRTPLTTIKALAHDISGEGDERASIIEEEADRLNRFVANLLDLSRITGGSLTVTPELTSADDLLGAVIQRVSGVLNGHELNASIEPGEPLLLGRFDFVHSLRILGNLVDNALKYSPPDAVVDLTARRTGPMLEFVVADRGPGVQPAEILRIFEPFYRPPNTPADSGGAGLGLSIARRLAEAQGGTVHYEPRNGGGSVFVFRVPGAELDALEGTIDRSL
jgi:two-component system sensor histidine kinase KdpD